MKKSIIVAMSENRVIGSHNRIPWHMPADMRYFREKTMGHPVIMGRKTFESMGSKPLKDRDNIILTRNRQMSPPAGCQIAFTLEEAFQKAEETGAEEAFVIGGSQVYELALPMVDTLYITEIGAEIEGDTYFPDFDRETWELTGRNSCLSNEKNPYRYAFETYTREKP